MSKIQAVLGKAAAHPPQKSAARQPDPWYSDRERRRRVNAASPRNAGRWLQRRSHWLR